MVCSLVCYCQHVYFHCYCISVNTLLRIRFSSGRVHATFIIIVNALHSYIHNYMTIETSHNKSLVIQ